jgi:hypothetical protein
VCAVAIAFVSDVMTTLLKHSGLWDGKIFMNMCVVITVTMVILLMDSRP